MAFRLRKNEAVQTGLRRILAKQVQSAVDRLNESPLTDEAVYEARKHIKKSRAVLRLVRKDLGGISAKTEQRLRRSSRLLSGLRDANAMLVTARGLCQPHGSKLTAAACRLVGQQLSAHGARTKRAGQRAVRAALEELGSAKRSATRLRLKTAGRAALSRGLKLAYKKAQRDMRRAKSRDRRSSFHQWRKQVKTLWYHVRLLSERAPGLRRPEAALEQLQKQLGREHNLEVFGAYVARRPGGRRLTTRLSGLADARRQRLRLSALRAGASVFAETPKWFVRRSFLARDTSRRARGANED